MSQDDPTGLRALVTQWRDRALYLRGEVRAWMSTRQRHEIAVRATDLDKCAAELEALLPALEQALTFSEDRIRKLDAVISLLDELYPHEVSDAIDNVYAAPVEKQP